eukprot:TRINITY_DN11636_c0_g1_i1.p1 TRINITY_DN11636_c0_g1~~TRINITY_DN11636_c0_g1_i1.p1  ORF type:complete len:218 (-),score=62.04 TRINITY_DN11636_c0_g1_i1:122-775(-)
MAERNVTLGYWGIRGLGEIARLLLELTETPYTDKRYTNHEEWFATDKPGLKTTFANLPYLKDGERVVTESAAISLHIVLSSGKTELLGKSIDDKVLVAQLKGVIVDGRAPLFKEAMSENYLEVAKKNLEENSKNALKRLSASLGEKQYLVGDYVTLVDAYMLEFLEHALAIDANALKEFPNLAGLHKRYLEIPQIKAYRESDRFKAKPMLNQYLQQQ